MKNLLTDISGVRVGNAGDAALASGVTAVLFDSPAVAAIDVRGGGPGTRDSALLDPVNTVERVDALVLSGGSAFGVEAGGVHRKAELANRLEERRMQLQRSKGHAMSLGGNEVGDAIRPRSAAPPRNGTPCPRARTRATRSGRKGVAWP